MKRSMFLGTLFAFVPLMTHAKATVKVVRDGHGFKVSSGEGRRHGRIKLKGVNSNI